MEWTLTRILGRFIKAGICREAAYLNRAFERTIIEQQHEQSNLYARSLEKIDKNSLWGELNIQKRELCVKGEFHHNILGLFENLFSEDPGDFRG